MKPKLGNFVDNKWKLYSQQLLFNAYFEANYIFCVTDLTVDSSK